MTTKYGRFTIINWGVFALLLLLFSWWHGAFESPLTADEIDNFIIAYKKHNPKVDTEKLRLFMEADDGQPVFMLNAIKNYDTPIEVNGKKFGNSSNEALEEYTNHVFPYLIKRGSYPIYSGNAAFKTLESWGIENAEVWTSGAIVRYRSRRVMMEMITDPVFSQFHDAKLAAIEKTIAYPTTAEVSIGGLGGMVFFILLSFSLIVQLFIQRLNFKSK